MVGLRDSQARHWGQAHSLSEVDFEAQDVAVMWLNVEPDTVTEAVTVRGSENELTEWRAAEHDEQKARAPQARAAARRRAAEIGKSKARPCAARSSGAMRWHPSAAATATECRHRAVDSEEVHEAIERARRENSRGWDDARQRWRDIQFRAGLEPVDHPARDVVVVENRQEPWKLRGHAVKHSRVDVVRADKHGADTAATHATKLGAQRLGEADNGELARRIVGLLRHPDKARRARDIHDYAAAPPEHARQHGAGRPVQGQNVHVEGASDAATRRFEQRRPGHDAGVIDENVHNSSVLGSGNDSILVRDIDDRILARAAGAVELRARRRRGIRTQIPHHNMGASGRHFVRHAPPEPAARARDEHALSAERPPLSAHDPSPPSAAGPALARAMSSSMFSTVRGSPP